MSSGDSSQRISAFNPVIFHCSRNIFVVGGRGGFFIIAGIGKHPAALGCFSVARIGNQVLVAMAHLVVEVDQVIRIDGFSQEPGLEVQVRTARAASVAT